MKKFIAIITAVIILALAVNWAYYYQGVYIDFGSDDSEVSYFTKIDGKQILVEQNGEFNLFQVKGVDMGSGIPGEWSTDFAVSYDTYLEWFKDIQDMGANTLRVYTIQDDTFYNAFYDYNKGRETPLYLLQGVWVNDYVQNSHRDAYSPDFFDTFLSDCKTMVDVIHGNRKINLGRVASAGSGNYKRDVSPWVIGYILGVEWEDATVAYTNDKFSVDERYQAYHGKYMETTEEATPFEVMLANVGDEVFEYESHRYKTQRLMAFSNWPTTDPFDYPEDLANFFLKCAKVDTEHIKTTDRVKTGQFASYHIYPYYPDYLSYLDDWSQFGIADKTKYDLGEGKYNTYRAYLSLVNNHHTMPVVISEFGVSTGRGMAQQDRNTNRNQGNMSEQEQGQAIISCYEDILAAGCNGGCIFTWQDEWFKRTWNTMYAVDMKRTPYWSDYQTNEQYFGMLSFDPGKEKSICYVDGDISDWQNDTPITEYNGKKLYCKYDEKFVYLMVDGYNLGSEKLYIPIDTTQKSGSTYAKNQNIKFDRSADFLLELDGKENSRLLVQERYEAIRSTYSINAYGFDTYYKDYLPDRNSSLFINIYMIMQTVSAPETLNSNDLIPSFETGILKYGNANPESPDFNSLADFIAGDNCVEIKIPWQLLNFADPSNMKIHDDYYDGNFGVEYITINKMYLGLGTENQTDRITLAPMKLKGWENTVTYHERLKESYYLVKDYWTQN